MHLQFRNPQIAWLFFRVPKLLDKPASRAALRPLYEDANPKFISKPLKCGLVVETIPVVESNFGLTK
jgi:hypothetical protein